MGGVLWKLNGGGEAGLLKGMKKNNLDWPKLFF